MDDKFDNDTEFISSNKDFYFHMCHLQRLRESIEFSLFKIINACYLAWFRFISSTTSQA